MKVDKGIINKYRAMEFGEPSPEMNAMSVEKINNQKFKDG